jgi:Fe-S cluster assembly protein SufD
MAFEERIDVHARLHDVHWQRKRTKVSQPKKEEAWKYTSSNAVLKMTYHVFLSKKKYCAVF